MNDNHQATPQPSAAKRSRRNKNNVVIKSGLIYARVSYQDSAGKTREIYRRAKSRTHAKELARQIKEELRFGGEAGLDVARMTFDDLAERYAAHYIKPAYYVGERKVSGLRRTTDAERNLRILGDYFGRTPIQAIRFSDLERFKLLRLKTPVRRNGKPRSIASVNRELQLLRAVLYFAQREGWLKENPFAHGRGIISPADEAKRDRILSRDEEISLLARCGDRRQRLKALIIGAIDTGCRRGELLKLEWPEVDLAAGIVTITAMSSKTNRRRLVGITPRFRAELERLLEKARSETRQPTPGGSVFGVKDSLNKSFANACREAGIKDLRFHDLRHTAITRMIEAGLAPAEVMKLSGHTQITTFSRYVNTDADTARRAAAMLSAPRAPQPEQAAQPGKLRLVG